MSFKITYSGKEKICDKPIKISELVDKNDKTIIAARINNKFRELSYEVTENAKIELLTTTDEDAAKMYEASLRYVLLMAINRINPELKIRLTRNVSRSTFVQILNPDTIATLRIKEAVEVEMKKIIEQDIPFIRHKLLKEDAVSYYEKMGLDDKIEALQYRPEKTVHLYECDGYYNYLFSRMVPSTGYLKNFVLHLYSPGMLLQAPRSECDGEIPQFVDAPTYGKTLKESHTWAKQVNAETVVKINEHIRNDGPIDFIQLCESRHNRQFANLGKIIEKDISDIRLICVAGPSSSGKTTFANRLRIELMSRGLRPIRISLDDYYLPKDQAPKDEFGNPDLESIEALDIELFNKNMLDLINGEEVQLPKFDFKLGKRIPGRILKVSQKEPIIIEGIHALNDRMTSLIPRHQKFKIFIAPQAQINLDNSYPISTVDLRLIRRLVRDYKFRAASTEETLSMWASVRRGEFKWIYETQEGADFVFNSLLQYELCVMKKYALPLLEKINQESQYFPMAERLLRMLKYFDSMPDEWVPNNSLLREFIGGSCYADA